MCYRRLYLHKLKRAVKSKNSELNCDIFLSECLIKYLCTLGLTGPWSQGDSIYLSVD